MSLGIVSLLVASSAEAADCSVNIAIGAAPSTCGSVRIIGAAEFKSILGTVVEPDFNKGPAGGSAISIALAPEVTAVGTASAQAGVLRLTAESIYSNADRQGFIQTRARANFSDLGTIISPNLAPGSLVRARASVIIDGTASRNAGILSSNVLVFSDLNNNLLSGVTPVPIAGSPGVTYDFDVHVGETVGVFLFLAVFADASFSTPAAAADFGNTARFFLDFATSDVAYNALSQHDYRTVIPTPVPAALPLLVSGLGVVGFAATRRRSRLALN